MEIIDKLNGKIDHMEELLMEKENSMIVASGGEESGEESGEVSPYTRFFYKHPHTGTSNFKLNMAGGG